MHWMIFKWAAVYLEYMDIDLAVKITIIEWYT